MVSRRHRPWPNDTASTCARRFALGFAIALILLLSLPLGSARADPTATPVAPAPEECTVHPLTAASLRRLAATPDDDRQLVTPPLTDQAPADAAITETVTDTIREAIACANANQPLRSLALFTDRFLQWRFGPDHRDDLESLIAASTRSPAPAADADRLVLIAVSDLRLLPDGRVSAVVITENAERRFEDLLILDQVDGRWLIDEWSALADADPATPSP